MRVPTSRQRGSGHRDLRHRPRVPPCVPGGLGDYRRSWNPASTSSDTGSGPRSKRCTGCSSPVLERCTSKHRRCPIHRQLPLATPEPAASIRQEAASRLSREVHSTVGQGSEVFVFAAPGRTRNRPSQATDADLAAALSLHDQDGALLVEFRKVARRSGGAAGPCAGCTIALSPGSYRLRVATLAWGHLEQVVIASPGWQTQVFLAQFPGDLAATGDDPLGGLDPARTSVLQARIGHGFDAQRDDLRLADLSPHRLGEPPRHRPGLRAAGEGREPDARHLRGRTRC